MVRSRSMSKANGDEASVNLGRLGGFIGFRLRRIQNYLSRDFADRTREFGLRAGALSALGIIEANPGINQARVAREIGQEASAAVALLDELVQRGWVERERLASDRRAYSIRLSEEGHRVYDMLLAELGAVEDAVLHSLSNADLMMLSRSLDQVYAACFRPEASVRRR